MPMCFNVVRRVDAPVSRAEVPRRKPAPRGAVTAVTRTAVGPLDSMLDTSLNASRHNAISRNPSTRNLTESQPVAARAQKHRYDEVSMHHVATYSHLRSTTCAVNDQEPETPAVRGRRQVAPPPTSTTPRLAKPGRRVYPPKPTSAPDAFKKGTHEGSAPDRSTPNLLKFSPRVGSAAHREAILAQRLARKQSTGMQKVLTWSTTPRAATLRPRTAPPAVNAPYDASLPQKMTSTATSSFRRPPTSTVSSVVGPPAGAEPIRRVRGTQRVATRPKTARGLLTWAT